MERILISGKEARLKVARGANKIIEAVASTAGPFGQNALIEKGLRITNDGMRVAQEITLEDEVEDLGARKIKEAMAKSNDVVGDGSTTIAILAGAILKESERQLGKEGTVSGRMTTASFIKKLKSERDEIVEKLRAQATPIESEEELIKSAIVSVEDETIGELIGKTQFDLGKEGYLLAEEVPEPGITVERVSGVRLDNGLGATHLFNNLEKQMLEVEDVPVILTNHILQSMESLVPLIDQIIKTRKSRKVAVIARGFSQEFINDVGLNLKNNLEIYPINAPYTDQREVMLDLASVLGGQFLDSEIHDLEDAQLSTVGFAKKIRARRYDAVITGQHDADSEKVQKRINELQETLAGSGSDFERKTISARIAQLQHGFAVVKVGAESETERKRVYDKVEDACNAVRWAFQEGTVKGAGLAFKEIADSLPDTYLLKNSLLALHTQILANAPEDFVIEDWVRDPVKVLITALEQAVSVAGDLSTVSVVVSTKKQKYNAFVTSQNND